MGLDIRLPIGLLFSVFGLVLTIFGLLSDRALYRQSLGINVNLGWGVVLLLFGIVMVVLGARRTFTSRSNAAQTTGLDAAKLQETTHVGK